MNQKVNYCELDVIIIIKSFAKCDDRTTYGKITVSTDLRYPYEVRSKLLSGKFFNALFTVLLLHSAFITQSLHYFMNIKYAICRVTLTVRMHCN